MVRNVLENAADHALAKKGSSARAGDLAGQAKQAFGTALANMKEIAELYTKSQQQVLATLGKRLRDSLEERGQRLGRKR